MTDDHELEAALRRVMGHAPADEAATARIGQRLAALPPQKRSWWPSALLTFDFAPAWPRIAALASAAVLGIMIGGSQVGTLIASDLNLVRVAGIDEGGVFDADSVTGLRP